MFIKYACEAADLCDGDTYEEGTREACEDRARRLSLKLSEGVCYVVAIDRDVDERIGHKVFISGQVDRVEGVYQ